MGAPTFAFGRNWKSFSRSALSADAINRARVDFRDLLEGVPLRGKTFLDIGFGQGLALCLAHESGAQVVGNDIDPDCVEALKTTLEFFPQVDRAAVTIVIGSIVDDAVMQRLRQIPAIDAAGGWDVVHSWGVLHHTGAMQAAIKRAASLVRPGGHLVLAIYNRHWTSPFWWLIKRAFVASPAFIQRVLVGLFYPVIAVAKLMVTRRNPFRKERGMDFYHDVIDWVGGFPYEYATPETIMGKLKALNFELERFVRATTPTGCNQFLFRRS